MAKFVMEEQQEWSTLPAESIVFVTVDSVFMKTVQGNRGDWEKLDFTFIVDGIQMLGNQGRVEDYQDVIGEKLYGSTSARFTSSPENKLRIWVEALFGMELGVGFELDTDYLIGRKARAITTTYEKKIIDSTTGKPKLGHKVDTLLRLDSGVPQPQQTQQAPADARELYAQQGFSTAGLPFGKVTEGDEPPF